MVHHIVFFIQSQLSLETVLTLVKYSVSPVIQPAVGENGGGWEKN